MILPWLQALEATRGLQVHVKGREVDLDDIAREAISEIESLREKLEESKTRIEELEDQLSRGAA